MNLLITGALGHIGSRLIRCLPPHTYEKIVLLDNLSTQRYSSLFDLPKNYSFQFIEDDILTANLEGLLEKIDVVIHLAARTDAEGSVDRAVEVENVNFNGTERLARTCAKMQSKLIFLSTTSVYGVHEDEVDETCSVEDLKPQSPYAESKLRSELLLRDMRDTTGLRFVACRFGTIFGTSPGMRFHTAVNKFCWQAVMGQPITVWKTAYEQKRPYLDLVDAVRALEFIMRNQLFHGEVYNVLTENATVHQIVDMISEFVPKLETTFVSSPIMNQLSYEVSFRKFANEGFDIAGNLRKGIKETITMLRSSNKQNGSKVEI